MYDPTIYDNLKVVAEGALYDLDREGTIRITGRMDLADLAVMGRKFLIRFELPGDNLSSCEVELASELQDFAAELAKLRLVEDVAPGCHLRLRFRFEKMQSGEQQMHAVEQSLNSLWGQAATIVHVTATSHTRQSGRFAATQEYKVEMSFIHKIDEEQIEDLQAWTRHAAVSLRNLRELLVNS